MPPLISRRKVEAFQAAFEGPLDSLTALYRKAMGDALEILSSSAATLAQRRRATALLRQYDGILARAGDEAAAWAQTNLPPSYRLGMEFADEGIRRARKGGINLGRPRYEVFAQVHQQAVEAIVEEFVRTSDFALAQIGRRVGDAFRTVGMEEVAKGIAEGKSRVEVSNAIRERLLEEGQPYFTDRLGRKWDLDRYAEMVARTTTREAASQGTMNRLLSEGIPLMQVSAHNAADFCIYYENVIVYIGPEPNPTSYPPISAISGGTPFHPNCLIPGSGILTRDGWRAIEEIATGDLVMTHQGRWRAVTQLMWRDYEGPLIEIGTLRVTPEHPVLTQGGWMQAGCLFAGDEVAVFEEGQDRPRREFRPLAIGNPDDFISQGGHGDVAGCSLGDAMGLAPCVHLDGESGSGEEEIGNVAADGMLEDEIQSQLGQGVANGSLVRMGVVAVGGGASDRHLGGRDFVPTRVRDPHPVPVAREGSAVLIGDTPRGASAVRWPRSNTVPGEPGAEQLCAIAAYLAAKLYERGTFCVAAAQESAQGLAERISKALFFQAPLQFLAATEGAGYARLNTTDARGHTSDRCSADGALEVHADKIPLRAYYVKGYSGPVYNLSVADDESYVAEGIVVHNCGHVMLPFVEALATPEELERGRVDSSLLNPGLEKGKHSAILQRRFRHEFPERARAEGKRLQEQAARSRARLVRREARAARGVAPAERSIEQKIAALGRRDVLGIGRLPDQVARDFNLSSTEVVLTGERRLHYLERHPEMRQVEHLLPEVIARPSLVVPNKNDPRMVIFYGEGEDKHVRAAVVLARPEEGRKHSVLSFRYARESEYRRDSQRAK